MRTVKTLKPGQSGTKALLRRFGPTLVCVRYRVDEATGERLKTVELVIQRGSRRPRLAMPFAGRARRRIAARPVPSRAATAGASAERRPAVPGEGPLPRVGLRIGWQETELRRRIKSAGGRWLPERRVWLLARDQAERLGLLDRVVGVRG